MRWPSAETLRTHGIRGAHFDERDRRLRARRAGVPRDPFGLLQDLRRGGEVGQRP